MQIFLRTLASRTSSFVVPNGSRAYLRPAAMALSPNASPSSPTATTTLLSPSSGPIESNQIRLSRTIGSDARVYSKTTSQFGDEKPVSLVQILEREIKDESTELNQRLPTDQFPGFSVETEDADVKLSKQVGNASVIVRFTVSSSLNEWRSAGTDAQQEQSESDNYSLLSLPEFQVQINKGGHTLEVSCYFEEMEHDEETGEPFAMDPVFNVDELVMYEGEPRETEFAASAEYFHDDLQDGLLQFLAEHGIDEEFAKNLVTYATTYEKKQYIGLMQRLKDFVSK